MSVPIWLTRGARVSFKPNSGTRREGTVLAVPPVIGKALVHLDDDPFPVNLPISQLVSCDGNRKLVRSSSARERPSQITRGETVGKDKKKKEGKELRQEAKALGVAGYDDMSKKELKKAVAAAKAAEADAAKPAKPKPKPKPKSKAPAKKPAAKKDAPAKSSGAKSGSSKSAGKTTGKVKGKRGGSKPGTRTRKPVPLGENPFRPGSNLHLIFPLLIKGGKRETLAKQLAKKAQINPFNDGKKVDLVDYDKRITLAGQTLAKMGYDIETSGRGLSGKIKAVPNPKKKVEVPTAKTSGSSSKSKPSAKSSKAKAPAKKPAAKKAANKKAPAKKAPAKKAAAKKPAAKKTATAKKAPAKKTAAKKPAPKKTTKAKK